MKQWLLCLPMALLAGCATLSEDQCRKAGATSWEGVGRADGQEGRDADYRLELHREACSKIGILPDRVTYMKGWNRGVLDYCTPDSGYAAGLSGSSGNDKICPGDSARLFRANVQLGRRVHELKAEINRVQEKIRELEKKLDDKNLERDARQDLRTNIRHRNDDLAQLKLSLIQAEAIPIIRSRH